MSAPTTSIDHHQDTGAAWDIIAEAISSYDEFMRDDDFDAQSMLDKIIARMRYRRGLYRDLAQSA